MKRHTRVKGSFKIAFYNLTTTTKSGGIETFNWEMANALNKRGHMVHIYGGRGDAIFQHPVSFPVYTYPYIRREYFPNFGTRFRRFTERLTFGFFTLSDLSRRNYDYIYLIKPYDIPVALLASAFSQARVIFGSSGTEFFPGYKYLAKKVDHFFACSEFNAKEIEEYCGMKPIVLHNGVDTERFKLLDPDFTLKHKLQLDSNETTIISACRLVGLKGIQYAISAVARLIKKGYGVRYLILGDGEYKKNLQSLAKDLNIVDNVIFLGNINNYKLPRYYSLANIAVFPSVADETFGISIAEAMACGVPIVATNVGGIPELVDMAGLLVTPEDEDALAYAMETLITNNDLRKELCIKGRRRIEENFRWEIIAEKFETYIRECRK
jgi:glycosyltransferase involved in cell wall biosynthesis